MSEVLHTWNVVKQSYVPLRTSGKFELDFVHNVITYFTEQTQLLEPVCGSDE